VHKASLKRRLGAVLACGLALSLAHQARASTTTYTYDNLGRVIAVTNSLGVTTNYQYDSAGNRTSQTISLSLPVVNSFTQRIAPGSTNNPLNIRVTSLTAYTLNFTLGSGFAGTLNTTARTYTPTTTTGTYTFTYTATNAVGVSNPIGNVTLNVDPTAHIWGDPNFKWGTSTNW
jgi:YD repeat-containing protein